MTEDYYVEGEPIPPYEPDDNDSRPVVVKSKGRVPPLALDAEEAVLGAMMVSEKARIECLDILRAEDFYKDAHRKIFEAASNVDPCDPITVAHELGSHLESVGGTSYLGVLTGQASSPSNAAWHARIVSEKAAQRRMIDVAAKVSQGIYEHDWPADKARELFGRIEVHEHVATIDPDVHDFLSMQEPAREWVWPDVLDQHERLILTGEEGGGKSTLIRQFMVQSACGVHPFTLEDIEPRRALLIDLENSERHVRGKLRALVSKVHGRIASRTLIPLIMPKGIDLLQREDRQWLLERVRANRPDVIGIGPLYKLAGDDPKDEETARAVAGVFDEIRELGPALVIEAHQPYPAGQGARPLRPFGASLWKRWSEFGLNLGPHGEFRHWRTPRDERAWPTVLSRGGDWPWTVVADRTAVNFTLAAGYVRDYGKASIRKISGAIGVPYSTLQRVIEARRTDWELVLKTADHDPTEGLFE